MLPPNCFEDGAEYVLTYAHDDVRSYRNEKLVKFGEEDRNVGTYNSNELWADQVILILRICDFQQLSGLDFP